MDEFKKLIGKTITSVDKMLSEDYDDEGCLRLKFSDGAYCLISAGYLPYTGKSMDEYPTTISIEFDIY